MNSETKPAAAEAKDTGRALGETVQEGAEVISQEVSKLRSEIAGLVDSVAQMGREKVHAITHNEKVTQGIAAGEAAIDRTTQELRALEHDIAKATRAYPFRALGIAAAVGFLAGYLARR